MVMISAKDRVKARGTWEAGSAVTVTQGLTFGPRESR